MKDETLLEQILRRRCGVATTRKCRTHLEHGAGHRSVARSGTLRKLYGVSLVGNSRSRGVIRGVGDGSVSRFGGVGFFPIFLALDGDFGNDHHLRARTIRYEQQPKSEVIETGKRVAIFVDGEGFIYMIRNLFVKNEFDRADYLPRNAKWKWFFSSIGKALGADSLRVFWYSIEDLDYFPDGDWNQMPFEEAEEKLKRIYAIRTKLNRNFSFGARKKVVNKYRKIILENREKMDGRLEEWHDLQDKITADYPMTRIKRPGWQACSLIDTKLFKEKAVDVGMAVDMLTKSGDFDVAVFITADGDFVPVVKELRRRGKENACLSIDQSGGRKCPEISRHLTKEMDYIIDLSVEDFANFMGIEIAD